MRVCFFASSKPREQELARSFVAGLEAHGDEGTIRDTGWPRKVAKGYDAAVMVGVKSKALFDAHQRHGIHVILLDKGYLRHRKEGERGWEYWRVAVNAHHPTDYLMGTEYPHDRLDALGVEFERWRKRGEHIVIAGSSAKYHAFYRLPEPTAYAEELVKKLRRLTSRPIVYRPKPSWRDAVPIDGTTYSAAKEPLGQVLDGAHVLVTHGSNACFEAALAGVPSIILGNAVAKPISSQELLAVHRPHKARDAERRQWLANLCYWQWTMDEFESGEAWLIIRERLERGES